MTLYRSAKLLLGILVLLVVMGFLYQNSLSYQPARLPNGAQYEPAACWFKVDSSVRTECGYMTTRPATIGGATFKLPIVVLRHSFWKNSESPMLHLSGGPGGAAYLDDSAMPYWSHNFKAQDWGVDFVLYDQRGTGLSQPFLDCSENESARLKSLLLPHNASADAVDFIRQMQQCYQQLAQKAETRAYLEVISTQHSAEDIADLHDLLGVKQWVLMGVSYGTRLALDTVKRFPEKVRSMVLDSVYPPEFDGFETMVENSFEGVDRLLNHCKSDTNCDALFPDLSEQFRQALLQLTESPLTLLVDREDESLPQQSILLTAHRLILLLDYASYDSDLLKFTPAAITAVLNQDNRDKRLLKLASNYLEMELFTSFSEPVYLLTECKENGRFDMTALLQRLQPYQARYPMLDWSPEGIFHPSLCQGWLSDDAKGSQSYRQSVTTDKPTLILSGGLDSITPPEWGQHLSTRLPNSRYIEYPNAGHSVLTSSLCANDEVQVFLNPQLSETAFCDVDERSDERLDDTLDWAVADN